uniref:Anaphase-promoting complex subunit 1 n=1 Tax=Compsopogon caeruleus TaxID=31354 RepID=A0A7S1T5E7_9RHOD|mmetsp:Transcript_10988/g.21916  ORF Transcript_10988/g.21916 Transcript_10988/m.21916 type:complete len:1197 (+) Transcript_10988:1763-5353(+)
MTRQEWRCLWEFFSDSRATIDQLRRVDSASSKWEVLEQLGLSEVSVSQFNLASKISSITYSYIPWVDGLDAIRRRIASRLLPMISRMEEASGMDRLKRKVQLELKELASTMRDLVGVPEETNDIKPPCFLYEGFRGGISAFHALIAGVQHHETNSMSCTATQCDVPMNEIDGENGEGQPLHMIPRVRLPSELCCRISGVLKHLLDPELTPAQVLLSLDQNCVGSSDFERLPFGIAIPILDGIWRRSRDISPVARAKLGLVHAEGGRVRNPDRWMAETYSRLQKGFEFRSEKSEVIVNEDIFDGCDMSGASTIEFRFSRDRRVAEVRRILRSSRPATLPINQLLEGGGASHDHQEVLLKCIARLLANPIGRGAFTFATQPISSFTKKAMIPKICLAGRIPDRQGALVHLTSESIPEGFLDWPMFHNGVAAGLRLRLDDPTSDSLSLRAWITDHLPSGNSFPAENSGLLLGLGLTGVLDSLKITDWYQFLLKQDELLSCAILLGVAAGKKGSMDNVVAKMLCLHIRYFNKNGFAQPDWSVSKPTQSAAMVGLGILYLGTNQRMIVEGLLHELTASIRPGDSAQGRESLSLAAGYGLGLTCLGAGRSAGGVLDLNIEDRLCRLIFGGQVDSRQSVDDTNRIDSISEANNDTEPILVVDGTLSNTSVTAPGAILALCLMYLKSDDRVIAEKLSIRESHFALECLRPEHLLLLVVCRSLVLWSEISPDVTWITNVMPKILQSSEGPLDFSLPVVDTGRLHHVDPEGIQQARVACVTGACMAIALKFAGTCEIRSFELIIAALDHVEKASKSFAVAEQDIWQTCTLQLVLALSVLTSGSGNLRCLRHLRRMYRQSIKSSFAHYIAISSAIGLLFLGGGCWTLGGSLSDIAFLLIALYPRFPSEPRDNLYHLQALRHLFALSAERRLLEPRDFDTGELCCVPIRLFLKETNDFQSGVKNVFAPCIIPPLHQISHIEVLGPRFWPSIYMLSSDAPQRLRKSPIAISVKRKSGYLPYLEDPRGFRGIFSRSLDPSHRLGEEFVRRFSENALAHSFARYLGNHPDPDRASFWRSALLECTIHNKLDAVILYMDVDRAMRNVIGRDCRGSSVASPICSLSDAYNLNMLRAYYDSSVPEWRKQVYAKETNHAIQLDKDLIPSDLRSSFFVLLEDQLIRSGKTEYSSETDPMVVSCCSRSQMVNGFREG